MNPAVRARPRAALKRVLLISLRQNDEELPWLASDALIDSGLLSRQHPGAQRREQLFFRGIFIALLARWPVIAALGPVTFFGVTDLFVAAVYDLKTRRRIHPATLWGGLFLIASQPLRLAIGFTVPRQAFVTWLTG